MPEALLQRLRRSRDPSFPSMQDSFEKLVRDGQHPTILFIDCCGSRMVP